jgi:hypothetical protein
MIKKQNLLKNSYYNGIGRNGNVGYWDGHYFHVFGPFFETVKHYVEEYHGKESGTFTPIRIIRKLNNFKAVQKVLLPRDLDRRVKLTEEDKRTIRTLYRDGYSIRTITKTLKKCSRRMIQFILFPERLKHNSELYKVRRKDKRYYDKNRHRQAIKATRRYKTKTLGPNI